MKDHQNHEDRLRKEAEARIDQPDIDIDRLSPDEIKHRLHALKVHQIELELQNEELRRTQAELATTRDRYLDLYQNAPTGHVTLNVEGVVTEVNNTFSEMIGLPPAKIRGRHFFQQVAEPDRGPFLSWFKQRYKVDTADTALEISLIAPEKPVLRVQLNSRLIATRAEGESTREKTRELMITLLDITEKWRWHRQLEETSAQLNAAIEVGNLAWWRMDVLNGTVDFHRKKTEMLGYDYQAFRGQGYQVFTDRLHPEDYEMTMQAMRDHLEGRTGAYSVDYRIRAADGAYRWFRDFGRITERSPTGAPLVITGIVVDITRRKLAMIELERSEAFARNILNSSPDAMFIIDRPSMTFVETNEEANIGLGFSRDELLKLGPHSIKPDYSKEKLAGLFDDIIGSASQTGRIETVHQRKDRSTFPVELFIRGVRQEGRELLIAAARDITERKAAEKRLQEALIMAETASKAKSTFLANMSHELRTPLNSILGFAQVLKAGHFGKLSHQQLEYAGYIEDSGEHLLQLINDILDLSKIEAGEMELEAEEARIVPLIEASLTIIQQKAAVHNVTLTFETDPQLSDLSLQVDVTKIRQVMFNLLSNAAKFTPDGGAIVVKLQRGETVISVAVADTGIGIAGADLERVFEPFYQVKGEHQHKVRGTGLGMSLCRQMIELHGGRIWVESPGLGHGTTVFFTLPLELP